MIDYVYGHDDIIRGFAASLIPSCRERGLPPASKTIGVIEDGDLVAGIVYHDWSPEAGVIEVSIAAVPGRQWLTRETIKRIYEYPFLQLGCQMIFGRVEETNERLLRILAALNYSFIRVPRAYGRDLDCILCTLTVEDWAANKFNKRFKHHEVLIAQREAA